MRIFVVLYVAVIAAIFPVADSNALPWRKIFGELFGSSSDDIIWRIPKPKPREEFTPPQKSDGDGILSGIGRHGIRAGGRAISELKEHLEKNSSERHFGECLLFNTARRGGLAEINRLLAEGANPNCVSNNGMTALIISAIEGHAEIALVLLVAGANVNHGEIQGMTALMAASIFGHADVVKVLLDNEADVNAQSKEGYTALQIAIEGEHWEVVRLLAVAEGDSEIIRLLQEAGVE